MSTWKQVLEAGVMAQQLIPDAVAVGGTAAALYAQHRLSLDTDHLLIDLRERFDLVREQLEACSDWSTARVRPPVLILGSLYGVEVGFRQMRRSLPIETVAYDTPAGRLVIPTIDELLGMKAYLAYSRGATRDFLDFAALSELSSENEILGSLLKSADRYGELQTESVSFEIAKSLSEPRPFDLEDVDLSTYKELKEKWCDWTAISKICQHHGRILGEHLVIEE